MLRRGWWMGANAAYSSIVREYARSSLAHVAAHHWKCARAHIDTAIIAIWWRNVIELILIKCAVGAVKVIGFMCCLWPKVETQYDN